jgi:hypothetical protein
MADFSGYGMASLTELEAFTGSIFSQYGAQTRRQRDKSIRLKDEFERILKWADAMIRRRKIEFSELRDGDDLDAATDPSEGLTLSLACLEVGCHERRSGHEGRYQGRSGSAFQSFKIVAACCVMKELNKVVQ